MIGKIVYSNAGRDSGRIFIIIGIEDENYVLLTDGNMRRLEKAKKKKIKHIIATDFSDENVSEKLQKGEKVTNADIRKGIINYLNSGIAKEVKAWREKI